METLNIFLNNPLVALFAIITLGMMLGKIKVTGVSLGNSAIIFTALIFGHFGYSIPSGIGTLGLVLFIYCVGIGAGPSFFGVFAKHGTQMVKLSIFIVGCAAVVTYLLSKVFHIPLDLSIGILAGALTSTPALAAAVDSLKDAGPLVSVGYGVAYPFGVIGVVLFVQVLPRILNKDLNVIDQKVDSAKGSKIDRHFVEVLNPSLFGKTIQEATIIAKSSCQISRYFDNGRFVPISSTTTFHKGQILLLIGDQKNAAEIIDYIGRLSTKIQDSEIESQRAEIVVTSKNMIGRTLRELGLLQKYGITVTKINRLQMLFVPTYDTMIEEADCLTVVGDVEALERFSKVAGHRTKALHETDLMSLSIGILLGVVVGMIPFGLPGSKPITLGLSGGPLLVALILGHYGRVGKIVGRIPFAAQYLMRELGLIFFLAHAGVRAGGSFVAIVQQYGVILFVFGGIVTLLPLVSGYFVATFLLKLNLPQTLGGLCGGMTSTPGLGTITAKTDSEVPVISYASAYPIALVVIIILVQILISMG